MREDELVECILLLFTLIFEGGIEIFEEGMLHVLGGEEGFGRVELPVDAEGFVGDRDAAVSLGSVVVVALVLEHGHVAQDGEAVGEPARHEELAVVILREFDGDVLSVGRGALADVNGHVEDTAADAAHELGLGVGGSLEMESAHHAAARHRLVVLHEVDLPSDCLVEGLLVVALEEVAARILEDAGLYYEDAIKGGFYHLHGSMFLGIAGHAPRAGTKPRDGRRLSAKLSERAEFAGTDKLRS